MKTMNNLALVYRDTGRIPEAMTLYEDILTRTKAKLGPNHPLTLQVMKNLATAYQAAGRLPEAFSLFEAALQGRQATLGPDHPDTLDSMSQLASAYLVDKPAQAETLLRQVLAILDKKSPEGWQSFQGAACWGLACWARKSTPRPSHLYSRAMRG